MCGFINRKEQRTGETILGRFNKKLLLAFLLSSCYSLAMDFYQIRKTTIIALFSDDQLMDKLVLKGGNAISLVLGLSSRTSLDLDFSLDKDFEHLEESRGRIERALIDRFDAVGVVVFDVALIPKPALRGPDERPWWGGYELSFKLIEKDKYERLRHSHSKMQIDALVVGPDQQRKFTADFSKHEYIKGKTQTQLEHFTINVYTPEMLVIEKLRAICQQMPEYSIKSGSRARARDFYDIHAVMTKTNIALSENLELIKNIFMAKEVPLELLGRIKEYREFHRPDWDSVRNSVVDLISSFDFYFDYVVCQVEELESLWVENSPE